MSTREKPPLEGPLDQYMGARFGELEEERVWAKVRARRALDQGKLPNGVLLPSPLAPALLEEDALGKSRARMWREVRARVHRKGRRRTLRLATLGGFSLAGALAVWALLFLTLRSPAPTADRGASHALLVADGRPLDALETSEKPLTVRLGDDSEIRLAAKSRIEPLTSTGSRFELLLARGSAEFSVTPGGPRRWLVEAGAARVEVVGTVFRVTRGATSVRVSVSRGSVLVRGENVPGWVQRLNAGEHLTVTGKERASTEPAADAVAEAVSAAVSPAPASASAAAAEASAPEVQQMEPAAPSTTRPSARPQRHRSRAAPNVAEPVRELSPAERYAALGPDGLAKATLSATTIEQLLELADIARLSGHPQDAVGPLKRALDAFRSSRQAALAAFTLGRVLLDQLNASDPAAEAFERALVLGLPRGLRADCYRRLAEAYERSSNYVESIRAEQRMREELKLDAQGSSKQPGSEAPAKPEGAP
jgi:transmembrane sensor